MVRRAAATLMESSLLLRVVGPAVRRDLEAVGRIIRNGRRVHLPPVTVTEIRGFIGASKGVSLTLLTTAVRGCRVRRSSALPARP